MPQITYIAFNGNETTVDVDCGYTVMEGAVDNNIDGIVAECGGSCSCATCHVYVDSQWLDRTGPPNPVEIAMLEMVEIRADNSRLSCQITVGEEHDGLVVRMPENQI